MSNQVYAYRRNGFPLDMYDYVLFLSGIWLSCGLSISLRLIGPGFIVTPVGFCVVYALIRRTMPPRMLGTYLLFCILVGVLSIFRIFPTSWQTYFFEDAIIRQLIPVVGVFAVAWGAKAYFRRRLLDGSVFIGATTVIVLSVVVAPLVTYAQGLGYEGDYSLYANIAELGAFINNMVIAFLFISGAIFFNTDWRRYAGLAFMLTVSFMSHFVQFKLLTVITIVALFGFPGRKVVMGAVAMFVAIYGVGMNYALDLLHSDPNDGLRLVFLSDVMKSVGDTNGIGIGYGKESVRWRYHFPGLPDFTFLPDPRSMSHARMLEALSTGVHNSFAQALLRSGAVGCLLLAAAFVAAFPPQNLPRNARNHAATVFAIMFIACFVNPALESPIQVVGIGFAYGYLLALKGRARVAPVRIRWSNRGRFGGVRRPLPTVPGDEGLRARPGLAHSPDTVFSGASSLQPAEVLPGRGA